MSRRLRSDAFDNVREQLDALAEVARRYAQVDARPTGTNRAFLYLIADKYVHGQSVQNERVLLLIGHRAAAGKDMLWGVPGGEQEAADRKYQNSFEVTAKREFAEEFLNINDQRRQKDAVRDIFKLATTPMQTVANYKNMAAFNVHFSDSLGFESIAHRFNTRTDATARRADQRKTHLSNETKGFAWVSVDNIFRAAYANAPPLDADGNLVVHDMSGTPLSIRPYTFGKTRNGRWKVNRWLARALQ